MLEQQLPAPSDSTAALKGYLRASETHFEQWVVLERAVWAARGSTAPIEEHFRAPRALAAMRETLNPNLKP